MPELTIIYWRDIPAQVVVKQGRQRVRQKLSDRFQVCIDRAAMRAKKVEADAYLDDWRRDRRKISGELTMLTEQAAGRLEAEYDDLRLERIVKNKGLEPGEN